MKNCRLDDEKNSDLMKNKKFSKKRYTIPLIIIGLLVIIRLLLPTLVKKYVNNVLAGIPGYYGQVADIDISLLRGAYVIDSLYFNKADAGSEVPFLIFPKTHISIEWRALFKGRIVSEIVMTDPEFIYVFEDQQKNDAANADVDDWSKALTDLVPLEINHFKILNGKAAFVQLSVNPNIDLNLSQIQLDATNLKNVLSKEKKLPSNINATAISIGNGNFKLDGQMNLVKQIPDVDVSFSLENAEATALNNFTKHYAGIDFTKGNFNVYSEIAIADGYLTGYMKPLLKNSELVDAKQDSFLNSLWEGFVGFFKFILKNKGNNTLATKIPIEGNLNKVESKLWPTIGNLVKNGWVKAFPGIVDDDVIFEDAKKEKSK